LDLAYSVPDEHARALIERAERWCHEPAEYPGVGTWRWSWLMRIVERRAPGWREALELMRTHAPHNS
jgi:hypothetical protein